MIILYLSPMALTLAFLYTSLLSWTVTGSFPHSVSREGIKEEKKNKFWYNEIMTALTFILLHLLTI